MDATALAVSSECIADSLAIIILRSTKPVSILLTLPQCVTVVTVIAYVRRRQR